MRRKSIVELSRRAFLRVGGAGIAAGAFGLQVVGAAAQGAGIGSLKIATIGAGREGGALGTLFAKKGHAVMFSSRHPEELKDLVAAAGPTAQAGTVEQAVAFGEVVLLVVPYTAVEQIGKDYGTALATKPLVLDVSNPIARRDGDAIVKWVEEQGGAGLATAKLLPGAHLVRAFNAIGSGRLAPDAQHQGPPVGVPIAGDDPNAIAMASGLIKEVGFEPVLIGGLAMGKYLVPGTALGGEHTPDEIKQIAASLK
ncbi:MAG TPA: NAD(P)-binding domain-containing protein [Stellaceae bacterium]|nr:NAD(P)-binding domain-containing protein [Stellaceae bacterium]